MPDARVIEARIRVAVSLLMITGVVWTVIPPHSRQRAAMRAARAAQHTFGWLAHHSARAVMAQELRTGRGDYGVPYLFSVLRDRAADAYTRWRTP